jgi:hypothetical protein
MQHFARLARIGGLVLIAFACAACGDDEATQRKAFITFLQTRIIDKQGLHVPHLTADEAKSFGDYAKQYAIITDFNDGLSQSIAAPMQEAMRKGSITSLGDIVTRHGDFVAVRDGMAQLRAALDKQLAAADAAHVALHQPDDLKPVFDKAYERDVTIPAKAFAEIFPDMDEVLKIAIAMGDFLNQHKGEVTINGSMLQTSNPSLQAKLTEMINAMNANSGAIAKDQQRLQSITTGG